MSKDWGILRTKLGKKEASLVGEAAYVRPLERRVFWPRPFFFKSMPTLKSDLPL
jgi:hypothetical protein